MLKKILIVTHHFYPENTPRAFRATELSKHLIKNGYSVDVVFGERKLVLRCGDIADYFSKTNTINLSSVSREHTWTKIGKAIFRYFFGERFILTNLNWVLNQMLNQIALDGYDGVISIGTPFYIHMAVARALRQQKNRIPSVCDNGDPFYNFKRRDKAFYFKYIQRSTFSAFDYICTPIEASVSYYAQYVSTDKIKVIPQGFNFENVQRQVYGRKSFPRFAYAGRFYKDIRNPKIILEYLCGLKTDFRFTIFTPLRGEVYYEILLPYKKKLGDKLELNEMVPREECIYELSGMDFLINLENTLAVQSPSKLIDYALAGRPILSFSQNTFSANILNEFMNGDYSKQTNIDLQPYDINTVCRQFIELLGEQL